MMQTVKLSESLSCQQVAAVANGAQLELAPDAVERIAHGRAIVDALVARGIKGYGINTGVGALCDVIVDRDQQQALSHNILMSHACGVGGPLGLVETRAIMAAQINNFAHGASGVRPEIVNALIALLNADCIPVVPSRGSVGYLTHGATIGLVLIGHGHAMHDGVRITGAQACAKIGMEPLRLQAKEGLSLVNGTPCATGMACLALWRLSSLLDWADLAAAMTAENLGCQMTAFAPNALGLRKSDGLQKVGETLRTYLQDSPMLAASVGKRTQDPLSVRSVPHVHGTVRDALRDVIATVTRELESVTDNPAVLGAPETPEVHSQAHAVGAALALSMDNLGVAVAELAVISERRIDRMVNPLVSGLPAFLVRESGVCSGYMIAQYTAVSLVSENRRLAAPASLDGGITSALQEDMLTHATPAAWKALTILDNLELVLGIELLAAAQAYDLQGDVAKPAVRTGKFYGDIRKSIPPYRDDRPMQNDFDAIRAFMKVNVINQEID
ncbi:MAG TPA: histidine ammonia-lyase [Thalassospira lucentensis]|uniref:Histidine ammonia-lyase n=2 Tax=Thalassospira lucentensis TaxID=168935 RepID=A0A358HRX0_9PROT|nr:histidine ammonia-lyase [Thalassospira lucentensis]HBU97901.1 histidine ammonia-lyase [Thalassospira lucentensis]HCW69085.1 histidine ammonia-lyase [Thalassospira lucentensis]|tara:strand:+ start:3684 stop:5186 length:1503 start_codon:yes stop_codon:yes gene_type:complete